MIQFLQDFTLWYNRYAESFYSNDPFLQDNILLKKEHTQRVHKEAIAISESLNLGKTDTEIALASALMHDIARFEQFKQYRTFKDKDSRDHGDWGEAILLQKDLLSALPRENQSLIRKAVKYHNKYKLPTDLSERELLHCKIVRDADKIDILHVITTMKVNEIGVQNSRENAPRSTDATYNPQLAEDIIKHINSKNTLVKTLNDLRLIQLSWLFDLNFPYTFKIINERGFIETLLAKLPKDELIDKVRAVLRKYMAVKIEENADKL